jgi:hypothetical protein
MFDSLFTRPRRAPRLRPSRAALLLLCSLAGVSCQRSEQTSLQPEKLASSSPSTPATADAPQAAATSTARASVTATTVESATPVAESTTPEPHETTAAAGPTKKKKRTKKRKTAKSEPLVPYAKGKRPDKPAPEPFSADPDPAGGAKAKPAPAKPLPVPVLTVLDAGKAPRKLLRIQTKAGHKERMRMAMQMNIAMELDGKKPPTSKLPPMYMDMDLAVAEVKDHTIAYDFVLSQTSVPPTKGVQPKVVSMLDKALANLRGMKGHAVIGDNGITKSARIAMPGKIDAQTQQVVQGMEQALQQISAPLPDEEVGVGARWTLVTHLRQNGVSLKQTANYELKRLTATRADLTVKLKQTAPKQKVHSPAGVTVDLIALESGGGGDVNVALNRLAPARSKLDMVSAVTMALPDGKRMKMTSTMSIGVNVK